MADTAQATAILSQIEGKMEEYLALGEDTPLAGRMDSMLSTVKGALTELRSGEAEKPPEMHGGSEAPEAEDSSPSDFRGATKAAREVFGRDGNSRGDRGGTKTEDEEQSPDEQDKKRRSKAY